MYVCDRIDGISDIGGKTSIETESPDQSLCWVGCFRSRYASCIGNRSKWCLSRWTMQGAYTFTHIRVPAFRKLARTTVHSPEMPKDPSIPLAMGSITQPIFRDLICLSLTPYTRLFRRTIHCSMERTGNRNQLARPPHCQLTNHLVIRIKVHSFMQTSLLPACSAAKITYVRICVCWQLYEPLLLVLLFSVLLDGLQARKLVKDDT